MSRRRWRISTGPDDLTEGLFGQIVLWTFELLPMLAHAGIEPLWDIRSRLYGAAPGFTVIPGVFDPATEPPTSVDRDIALLALRTRHVSVLGGDWQAMHDLWHRYFRVPPRTVARADELRLPDHCLGLHYRGTDKNLSTRDTNPVKIEDFLDLAEEFIACHPDVTAIFLATDEYACVRAARQRFVDLPVFNLGEVTFHKHAAEEPGRADRALLDCLLLSRCAYLLKCSSALSGFAKVLNPGLTSYRVAASKMFGEVPYFPDAYIPRWSGHSSHTRAILARQFEGDWLDDPAVPARFRESFVSLPRYSAGRALVNRLKYRLSLAMGEARKA